MNETHDPALRSFVESANDPAGDFPIQNLPFGVFSPPDSVSERRIGVAIGSEILDLKACLQRGLFNDLSLGVRAALSLEALNGLMSLGAPAWSSVRRCVSSLLRHDSALAKDTALQKGVLLAAAQVEMRLPALIRNYTDFYASLHHATNVGKLFRPDNPLLPNYKHVPIAYHGRSSSIVPAGTQIHRPRGQVLRAEGEPPIFEPTKALDYEIELGLFVGPGNMLGMPIGIDHAKEHVIGFCLLNDWSARDIQRWEYQPLGPFLAKNFATSISPWIVTAEALEPFRCPPAKRAAGDPEALPYLNSASDAEFGAFNIHLEVSLHTPAMRQAGVPPQKLSRSNARDLYWTPAQWIAHHTSNGCNLLPGDLLGSGTISGPEVGNMGCLAEITEGGRKPLTLNNGENRRFLEDGDEVIFRGWAEATNTRRIGFGDLRVRIKA